jgi:hypothetical protein
MSQIDQIVSIIVSNIAIITSEVATCIAKKKTAEVQEILSSKDFLFLIVIGKKFKKTHFLAVGLSVI